MDRAALQQTLMDNLDTAIVVVDEAMRVVFINPAGQTLFGVSSRQTVGSPVIELVADADEFVRSIERAVTTGESFTERELQLVLCNTFEKIHVDCTFTQLPMMEGRRIVMLELRRIDRLLRITREENRLAQQNALKVLVRGLAHEVKNPLGGLRGAAQLLERELDSDELREYTQVIIGEADRLQTLVDDMLGPNKVPRKSETNIHQVLERVRQLVLAESGEGLLIVRDYDPSIPEFSADPDRLIQATLNIVRNASQALGGKGKIVLKTRTIRQFTIGSQRHRLVVKIEIIDNGPGIPPELIDQVFYPMVTSRAEGTGLGLSIAQTIIAQHDGLIECTSEPGNTVFSILLPIRNGTSDSPKVEVM